MYPFIYALNGASRLLLRVFGVKPAGHETVHSEEELKWIVDQSYESGEINQTEMGYLTNIFAFEERTLREIMVPRDRIVTVERGWPLANILEVLGDYDYTRYPVTEAGPAEDFIGFIHTKEMLTGIAAGRNCSVNDFIHDMPRFPESSSIKDVLIKMQQIRVHMAVVTNESGEAIGLVTMEDILEEIVGDIRDESDRRELQGAQA